MSASFHYAMEIRTFLRCAVIYWIGSLQLLILSRGLDAHGTMTDDEVLALLSVLDDSVAIH